jgi:hypothetical protein
MKFNTACIIGMLAATPFGLAFVAFPEQLSALYGITNWNPGTTVVGRLYGVGLLYAGGAAFSARASEDIALQRLFGATNAVVSAVGAAVCLHSVVTSAANALMWTTVALFIAMAAMWWSARPRG